MKNKIKLALLPIFNSGFYVASCVTILCILILGAYQILILFPDNIGVYKKLDNTELFIEGRESNINYSDFEPIFPFTNTDINLECEDVSIGINDNKFNPKLDVSDELNLQLQDKTASKQITACPDYTSDQVQEYHIPNSAYGFELIEGDYPKAGEVLIGEYIANLYASEYGYTDYGDLIGQEINVSNKSKTYTQKISGITTGGFKILYNTNFKQEYQKTKYSDYYVNFDSKAEKELFVEEHNLDNKATNITYYESENYNYTNPKTYVILISLMLELVVVILILKHPLKQIKSIIKFYNHQRQWYLIYFVPLCLIIIITLINVALYNMLS